MNYGEQKAYYAKLRATGKLTCSAQDPETGAPQDNSNSKEDEKNYCKENFWGKSDALRAAECCNIRNTLRCGKMAIFDYCGYSCQSFDEKRCEGLREKLSPSRCPACRRRRRLDYGRRRRAPHTESAPTCTHTYTHRMQTATTCSFSLIGKLSLHFLFVFKVDLLLHYCIHQISRYGFAKGLQSDLTGTLDVRPALVSPYVF